MVMQRAPGRNAFPLLVLALIATCVVALATDSLVPLLLLFALYWAGMVGLLVRLHTVPARAVEERLVRAGLDRDRLAYSSLLGWLEERVENEPACEPLHALVDWLRTNAPPRAEPPSVCHGDFWFGNLIVSPRGVTLLDWTQACLAQPELDLGWISIQHYSRLALPLPEWALGLSAALLRPFAWLLMGATRWCYRLVRPVDPERVRYFGVFSAGRVLAHVTSLRAREDGSDAAMLSAWGSAATLRLLRRRVRRTTGIDLEL
jgi:hypothetical protein